MTRAAGPVVEIKILDRRLEAWGLPRYHSDMAAAIDLHACIDAPIAIEAGAVMLVGSGIAVLIGDPTIAALVLPRSGLGHKKGLVLGNLTGLIDPDYSGEIKISAWNRNPADSAPIVIAPGERIAQMLFVPVVRPVFQIVETFSTVTVRGDGGFGSTES